MKVAARDLMKRLCCSNICLCFSPPIVALSVLIHLFPKNENRIHSYIDEKFRNHATEIRKLCQEAMPFISEVIDLRTILFCYLL